MAENNGIRDAVLGGVVLLVCAIGGLAYYASRPARPITLAPPSAPPVAPAAAPAAPEFDVVRVDPSGNAVIAGRAAPGANVSIKLGSTVIGSITADANGAFAFVPDTPLPPGAQQLTLSETLPGGQVIAGSASASVDVPAVPSAPALAVLSGPGGSKVVSGQGPAAGSLGIGTVDYDANGHAIFSGTAPAGDHITLALGGAKIGDAVTGPDGRWTLSAKVPHDNGTLIVADGNAAPVTAPFALETLPDAVADGHIIIAPGQNLWLIARHVYGQGNLYTLIYKANTSQIRDPNLIFPGQAFALPKPQG